MKHLLTTMATMSPFFAFFMGARFARLRRARDRYVMAVALVLLSIGLNVLATNTDLDDFATHTVQQAALIGIALGVTLAAVEIWREPEGQPQPTDTVVSQRLGNVP